MMKKYLKFLFVIAFSLIVCGCESKVNTSNLVGLWKLTTKKYIENDTIEKEKSIYFYEDNTFIAKECSHLSLIKNCDEGFGLWSGTYKKSNNKILLTFTESNLLINEKELTKPSQKLAFKDEYRICELDNNNNCTSIEYNSMLSSKEDKYDITKVTVNDSVENFFSDNIQKTITSFLDEIANELNVSATKLLNKEDKIIDFKYKTYYYDNDSYHFVYENTNKDSVKYTIDKKEDSYVITFISYSDGKDSTISSAVRNMLPRNSILGISKKDIDVMSSCFNRYYVSSCGDALIMTSDHGYSLPKIKINIL